MKILFGILLAGSLIFWISPFPGWFDSGELALASYVLGVSHPPGQPFYIHGAKIFTFLPLGSIAFRTSLFSVFATLGSLWMFQRLVQNLSTRFQLFSSSQHIFLFSWAVPFLLLVHPSITLQTTRTEVYALVLFLTIFGWNAIFEGLEKKSWPWISTAFLSLGFCFGVHPAMALLELPLFFYSLFLSFPKNSSRFWTPWVFLGLGFFFYLALPIRAQQNPILNWGDPITWNRFLHVIQAKDYQSSFFSRIPFRQGWDIFRSHLLLLIPFSAWALAGIGFLVGWKKNQKKWVSFLAFGVGLNLLIWIYLPFSSQNPDFQGYLCPLIALFLLLSSFGAAFLSQCLPLSSLLRLSFTTGVLILSFASALILGPSQWVLHGGTSAKILSHYLEMAPPSAQMNIGSDHWLFPLWYAQKVEGRRPDILLLAQGLLPASWYQRSLQPQWKKQKIFSSILLEEKPFSSSSLPTFFLGKENTHEWVQKKFLETCLKEREGDFFSIQKGICTHVILTWARGMNQEKNTDQAIQLLEKWIPIPFSKSTCKDSKTLNLPFPLATPNPYQFLDDPRQAVTQLMLFYLGCQEPSRAQALQEEKGGNVNAWLLKSYLFWEKGNKTKAIQTLQKQPFRNDHDQGFVALALAHLYASQNKILETEKEFKKAKLFLGESSSVLQKTEPIIRSWLQRSQ